MGTFVGSPQRSFTFSADGESPMEPIAPYFWTPTTPEGWILPIRYETYDSNGPQLVIQRRLQALWDQIHRVKRRSTMTVFLWARYTALEVQERELLRMGRMWA